ncbi:uncharacterized protein LOC118349897 [Juglans regia]|uniref:Uncharacterized protein LOC118349897 n=1 Tax=Juglans regia TaxID=51240 RepID=A0A6P9FAU6_JUGRE|nr:uncharacterized protein LOC118349897 [Juglans regia]
MTFKYEACLALEEECEVILKEAWTGSSKVTGLLDNSRKALQRWNKNKMQRQGQEVEEKTKILQNLQAMENGSNVEEIRKVTKELHLTLEKEDLWWKQRAKRNWYKHGDRNTKYFHACAKERRKRNFINEVEDENNRNFIGFQKVEETFRRFFGKLFQTTNPSQDEIDKCLVGMSEKVTIEMNERLSRRFTSVEVEEAVKQMAPLKAPGPDGFGPCFYQNHWGVVSDEVCRAALDILNVLINGVPGHKFLPSRGLRQGDHLSPYLFIVCAEGLSSLLDHYEKSKLIRGVQVARGGTSINHLLFANDCILFGRANIGDWRKIQEILLVYEKASGQFLNKGKTSVFFSNNPRLTDKQAIKKDGNSFVCGTYEKYLGLPAMVGRSKFNTFRTLKEKLWQKVSSWKNTFLSQAGKEVLIKVVLQSIPTFTMGVFKLSIKLCKEINIMLSKFRWGSQQEGRGMVWRKWEKMSMQKGKGGMGFRDMESFNVALLAKQGWRILKYPMSLAAVLLKEKYFRFENFLEAKLGAQPSLVWRSIWSARDLLREGLRWKVGDGKDINIWRSKWLTRPTSFAVQSPVSLLQRNAKVIELIDSQKGEWDESIIRTIFSEEEAEQILCMPLSRGRAKDKIIWGPAKKGLFTGAAKEVVEAVLSEEEAVLEFSPIIDDVKFHFRNRTHWFIQYASRKKNTVAHTLAKKALEIRKELVWIEEVPEFIVGCLLDDTSCNT